MVVLGKAGPKAHLPGQIDELAVESLDGCLHPFHLGYHPGDGHHDLHHALLEPGVDARRHGLQLGGHGGQVVVQAACSAHRQRCMGAGLRTAVGEEVVQVYHTIWDGIVAGGKISVERDSSNILLVD